MPKVKVGQYHCAHCKKTVERQPVRKGERLKQWMKSFCTTTGRDVRLQLVKSKR